MLPNQDSMPGMAFIVLQTACPKAVPAKKVGKMKPPRNPTSIAATSDTENHPACHPSSWEKQ